VFGVLLTFAATTMASLDSVGGIERDDRLPGRVLLVHGIQSDGRWMIDAEPLLSPFFKTVLIEYPHFRHLGAFKLLFEPLSFCVALIVAWVIATGSRGNLWLGLLVGGAGVLLSRLLSRRLLESAIDNFVVRFSREADQMGRPTHVIAHSLGTYLTATALQRFPGIQLGRVILCGCVLPRYYPWQAFRKDVAAGRLNARIASIRNEMGLRDWVPRAALWARRVGGPRFGSAGLEGFTGSDSLIHEVPEGSVQCPRCVTGVDGFLHNVRLDFSHSTGFLGGNQCKYFWVPFLLNCDPGEFRKLLNLSASCYDAQGRDPDEINFSETELREYPWRWCEGRPLEVEVRKRLSRSRGVHPEQLDLLVANGIRIFWHLVAVAQNEPYPGGNPDLIRLFDPRVALQRTIEATIRTYVH
jgi:pimeloyl-ACP methyl ester carboxylesterase